MTYLPGHPPGYPAAGRPASGLDIAMSILALLLALCGAAVAAFFGVFFMAFTDYCPPETCDIDAGMTALFAGFITAAVLWVVGTAVTIVAMVRRRRAWPWAGGTLVLTLVPCVAGIAGYLTAISG